MLTVRVQLLRCEVLSTAVDEANKAARMHHTADAIWSTLGTRASSNLVLRKAEFSSQGILAQEVRGEGYTAAAAARASHKARPAFQSNEMPATGCRLGKNRDWPLTFSHRRSVAMTPTCGRDSRNDTWETGGL